MRPARVALLLALFATNAAHAFDAAGIDEVAAQMIESRQLPGAVVLVGQGDQIVFEKAYGSRALLPTTQPMKTDTIFDLASLSKNIGTATSVMILIDRGQVDLAAPVAKYLPEFGNHGKEAITVEQLLTHSSGLIADNPMSDYANGPAEAIAKIMDSAPVARVGSKFTYSDVNFIVLGKLVERVSGKTLDRFAHDEIFAPLKMTHTAYNPPAAWKDEIAPTEQRKGEWIRGEVHDPRAYALDGVAGHAGVFSTAQDVSRWVRMLNAGGTLDGVKILSPQAVRTMLAPRDTPDGKGARGLGVDISSPFSPSVRGNFPLGTSFGHTGWTGTSYWSDATSGVYAILLTSRCHPDGKGSVTPLRRAVANATADQLIAPTTRPAAATKPAE